MKHPAFETIPRALLFISIFILAGALIPLCLTGLISVKTGILILQGVISGMLLCGISVLLWFVTRFTRLSGSNAVQRILNHVALLSLTIMVWLGTEYMLFYIFFPETTFVLLTSIIPFKIVIGLLIFLIVIQSYNNIPAIENIDEETDPLQEPLITETPAKPAKKDISEKVTVKSGSNINIINVSDIIYIQAEGDYVILYTESTRYIKEDTMKHFEEQLPAFFIRIHRSCIMNTNFISRIELYEKQNYRITLKTGQQLKASATGYKMLKEKLNL